MMQQAQQAPVEGAPTTVMFRNLPRKYGPYDVLSEIGLVVDAKSVDFVYLPWDGHASNMGYAFVNFTESRALDIVYSEMHGKTWRCVGSTRRVKILPASVHGLAANLEHCEPRIYATAGQNVLPLVFIDGQEIEYYEALHLLQAGLLPCAASARPSLQPQQGPEPQAWQPQDSTQPLPQAQQTPQQQQQNQPRQSLPKLPIFTQPCSAARTAYAPAQACGLEPRIKNMVDRDTYWSGSTEAPERVLTGDCLDEAVPRRHDVASLGRSLVSLAAVSDDCSETEGATWPSPGTAASPPTGGCAAPQAAGRDVALQTPGYERAWADVQVLLGELLRRTQANQVVSV